MPIETKGGTSAIVVGLNTDRRSVLKDESSLEELELLARTAGFRPIIQRLYRKERIDPANYLGCGKARDIRLITRENDIEAVILDFELSPVQIRNLKDIIKKRIVPRTELILEIFAQRARTKEAKLQVELATLIYSLPRLRHMWPHLGRIAGGIGAKGPGEKQIEMDKRRIRKRIAKIKTELVSVSKHRMTMRKNRQSKFKAALVGYTNAGKSSVLNVLSHSSLFTENRLFATLDPATREVWLGENTTMLVTDTVGFIKDLPPTLIDSFRSTLEEVKEADLLLHAVDISNHDALERIQAVDTVLKEIGAAEIPVLYVFNKVDLLERRDTKALLLSRYDDHVVISAKTKEGIDTMKHVLLQRYKEMKALHLARACGSPSVLLQQNEMSPV
ncbi:MAG: GTPase HflX [Spirochaetes bacterium]|nr:GTPase HflX [Spirochaetota bacterium]